MACLSLFFFFFTPSEWNMSRWKPKREREEWVDDQKRIHRQCTSAIRQAWILSDKLNQVDSLLILSKKQVIYHEIKKNGIFYIILHSRHLYKWYHTHPNVVMYIMHLLSQVAYMYYMLYKVPRSIQWIIIWHFFKKEGEWVCMSREREGQPVYVSQTLACISILGIVPLPPLSMFPFHV